MKKLVNLLIKYDAVLSLVKKKEENNVLSHPFAYSGNKT